MSLNWCFLQHEKCYSGPLVRFADNSSYNSFELQHEISKNVEWATSKYSDQPAHMRSLNRAFASLLNILWILSYWPNIICRF